MRWFRRSEPTPPVEEAPPLDRYEGKPLLILMENYVLDCIGELDPEKHRQMGVIVRRVFGGGEDWKATLRAVVDLKDTADDSIRRMWQRNQEIARANDVTLTPQDFAVMFADANFSRDLDDA